ncbi:MAG: DegV family protein, partial [Aristaeellaceae bacterium]
HWFTVDDLMFLMRGGRVGAVSAYIGSLVKIKPVMHVNEEGKLIPREKVQGRRKSIRALADKVKQNIVNPEGQLVLISHGDCEAEAQSLADMIRAELPVAEVRLSYIGPIVGAHSGPGTLAVFFMGRGR